MTERSISVVVPVYEEGENIGPCLRGLWRVLSDHEHEILICYDFEEDPTLAAIEAMPDLPASVRLVKNAFGRGAANALKSGFLAAEGDVVVTTMADLSDPPDAIPAMAELVRSGAAVVSGSRYMRGGSLEGGPFLKSNLSRLACLSLHWIAGVATHDATNNFRAYDPNFLERAEVESDSAFDIALELTVKAHIAGERVAEVPTSWVNRSAGDSRFKVWAWMPKYLRWWWIAMAMPVLTWVVFLILLAMLTSIEGLPASRVLLLAVGALIALVASRALRGMARGVDLLLPVMWLHPGHVWLWERGWFAADVGGTLAMTAVMWVAARKGRGGRRRAAPR